MEAAAKLVTAIATLLGAIAWPLLLVVLVVAYRGSFKAVLSRLPPLLDRVRKLEAPFFKAELDGVAATAPADGRITLGQIRAAANVAASASRDEDAIRRALDSLCLQYDAIRRVMPSGQARTQEMTRIIVQMRALGPSSLRNIETYKGSGSPGSRLAAIAMMQMDPAKGDLPWLAHRFNVEAPFLFYHAALALTNMANISGPDGQREIARIADAAARTVRSFDGVPDEETLHVLEALRD